MIGRFVRCSHCGTVMYYEYASLRRDIAVNARNFEPSILGLYRFATSMAERREPNGTGTVPQCTRY